MTTIKYLYDLQELDSDISDCRGAISSIDSRLGERSKLEAMAQEVVVLRESLDQLRLRQRAEDLDAESMRTKTQDVEGKLYGGTIRNPRELEGYQKEADHLRGQLKVLDDALLETMVALEEVQRQLQSREAEVRRTEELWQSEQLELSNERVELERTLPDLESRRQALASGIGQRELRLYELLRGSKGGMAIARVERGLCRACHMALPTRQVQQARLGREPVQCNSCGRILYVS